VILNLWKIPDEVYNKVKLKVKKCFKNEKCSYSFNCYKKIDYKWFFTCQIKFGSLNKNMYNMIFKSQFLAF
jgi:hypothetical protein